MDDLLAELGGGSGGIGLNIIAEPAAVAAKQLSVGKAKKKKNNRFERLREKARRAKEAKEPGGESDGRSRRWPVGNVDPPPAVRLRATKSTTKKAEAMEQPMERSLEEGGNADPVERSEDLVDGGDERGADDLLPSSARVSDDSEAGVGAIDNASVSEEGRRAKRTRAKQGGKKRDDGRGAKDEIVSTSTSSPSSTLPPSYSSAPEPRLTGSRRKHGYEGVDDLANDHVRAEYMATYHARPAEIDRRSGAVARTVTGIVSQSSDHIFEDVDDGDDTGLAAIAGGPFGALGLHPRLVSAMTSERGPFGHDRPMVIQRRALSSLLPSRKQPRKDHNLFVQSETGSGKTLAYLLPIVQSLAVDFKTGNTKRIDRCRGGTRCLIICPTRELATQTNVVAEKLCLNSFSWLVPGCLSGGEKRKSEKARLRKGISILIATPGRLLDHLDKTDCLLMALKGKMEWLVLDEADRLLDMGLGGQVESIVQQVRANQPQSGPLKDGVTWRSVLVSATVTDAIEGLAKKTLGGAEWKWVRAAREEQSRRGEDGVDNENATISYDLGVATECHDLADATPRQLAQLHLVVSAKLRLAALVAFLAAQAQRGERTVVFMSTCDCVDYHHALFSAVDCILASARDDGDEGAKVGIFGAMCPLYRLHGNVPHAERHTILNKFSSGGRSSRRGERGAAILLATDVAARGLNLPDVDWIVQYDPPCETADYVHRAGRAARAGRAGHALLFLLPSERGYVDVLRLRGLGGTTALSLESTLKAGAEACPDLTAEGEKRFGGSAAHGNGREGEAFSTALQKRLERCIVEDDIAHKEAGRKKKVAKKGRVKNHEDGPLLVSARQAFLAYIRAYPAKEKAIRHIFSPRALHLGHIAKSFALKEAPTASAKVRKASCGVEEGEGVLKSTGKKRNARLAFSATATKEDKAVALEEEELPPLTGKNSQKKRKHVVDSTTHGNSIEKERFSAADNPQRRMTAAAKQIQCGGLEFF